MHGLGMRLRLLCRFSECVGGLGGLAVAHRWSSLHWGHRDYPGGQDRKRRIGSILSCENGDGLTLPRHAQDQLKQKLEENAVPFFRGPNRTAVRGRSRAATAGAGPSRCSRTSAGNVSSFAVSFIAFNLSRACLGKRSFFTRKWRGNPRPFRTTFDTTPPLPRNFI